MGFRDDGLASQERAEALEREVERLEAENEALRAQRAAPETPEARKGTVGRLAGPIGAIALLGAVGAAVAPAPPQLRILLAIAAAGMLLLALQLHLIGRLLYVVQPGELLVLSGVSHTGHDGRRRGYRVVTGGRVLRKPMLETATWMTLGPFPLALELQGLFARRDRVDLRVSATIAVSTYPGTVDNAVERFLGRPSEEIVEVARQTIEGTLREVVANLSLRELQEDGPLVARKTSELMEGDLEKLGLELPTFVLEEVNAAREG